MNHVMVQNERRDFRDQSAEKVLVTFVHCRESGSLTAKSDDSFHQWRSRTEGRDSQSKGRPRKKGDPQSKCTSEKHYLAVRLARDASEEAELTEKVGVGS